MFSSFVKVLIGQIHAMPPCELLQGGVGGQSSWKLGSHPVSKVEVLGYLVGVKMSSKYVQYTVDDGTGVVQCKRWYNNHNAHGQADQQDQATHPRAHSHTHSLSHTHTHRTATSKKRTSVGWCAFGAPSKRAISSTAPK